MARTESLNRFERFTYRAVDRVGLQPLSLAAFLACVFAVFQLGAADAARYEAKALGHAELVEHPAPVASYVAETFVVPGQQVTAGTPLVRLAAAPFEARLAALEHEVRVAQAEADFEAARIEAQEELWLDPELRSRRGRPSLRPELAQLHASRIASLLAERETLQSQVANLDVHAIGDGVVEARLPLGAAVRIGDSVASITPEFANEIVAYANAALPLDVLLPGAVATLRGGTDCATRTRMLRRGPRVQQAPGQLQGVFAQPIFGVPLYVELPQGCRLAVGEAIQVYFERSSDDSFAVSGREAGQHASDEEAG